MTLLTNDRSRTMPLHVGVRVGRNNRFAPILPAPPEWTERAVCAQTDPEEFFPEKGGSTRQAKAVCRGCEVRTQCLAYAVARGERFGVWGGLSERERRALTKSGTGPTRHGVTREFDAEVAALTASGWTLAAIAERLDTTDRRVSRARARNRATTTTTTHTTEDLNERRAAA